MVTIEKSPVIVEPPKIVETVTTTIVEEKKVPTLIPTETITTVVEEVKPVLPTQVVTTLVEKSVPRQVTLIETNPVVETVQTTTVTKQLKKPKKKIISEKVALIHDSLSPKVGKIVTIEVISPSIVTPVITSNIVE